LYGIVFILSIVILLLKETQVTTYILVYLWRVISDTSSQIFSHAISKEKKIACPYRRFFVWTNMNGSGCSADKEQCEALQLMIG
jgi:uncharacterized membrane protein